MDDRRPGEGSTWGGGSYEGSEPGRAADPQGDEVQEGRPPAGETASNFPTFGQTPGWQEEPDPYGSGYGAPGYGKTGEDKTSYGKTSYGKTGYGAPGYGDTRSQHTAFDTSPGYPPPYDYSQAQPPAPYPGQPGDYGGYTGGYASGYPGAYPQTEASAIIALVLSIVSWVICPFIPAVIALFLASSSKAKIRAFPHRYTGLGLITAANIISWINIGVTVIGALLFVVAIAASGGPSAPPPPGIPT
jgi:hypothetical protein